MHYVPIHLNLRLQKKSGMLSKHLNHIISSFVYISNLIQIIELINRPPPPPLTGSGLPFPLLSPLPQPPPPRCHAQFPQGQAGSAPKGTLMAASPLHPRNLPEIETMYMLILTTGKE